MDIAAPPADNAQPRRRLHQFRQRLKLLGSISAMPSVTIRLFAGAREAAGVGSTRLEASSVGAALETASEMFGAGFCAVLAASRVWLNGEPADAASELADGDEIAVLPPVSGG